MALSSLLSWVIIIVSGVYLWIQFDTFIQGLKYIFWGGQPIARQYFDSFMILSPAKRLVHEKSPISELPLELLGEIFLSCCDDSNTFLRPRRSDAPIVLCQISRLWRFTALSTPGLWSSISVTHRDNKLWPSRALIRSWVKRSKGAPLSFELVVEDTMHSPSHDISIRAINELFLLFLFQFDRWKHVRLVVPLAAHLNIDCISPLGVSMLQSLHIQVGDSPEALGFLPLITDRSPYLRSLIWQLREHPKPPVGDATLRYLTELYLECALSPMECLILLETCRNLCICEFENVCNNSPLVKLQAYTIRHRTIHTLRIEATVDLSILLACLTLPSLISLSIVISHLGTHQVNLWAPRQLSRLISRSSPPLESLLLENVPIGEVEIIMCLVSLPTLVSINITSENPMPTNKIIFALGNQPTSVKFICPKLEVIKLCGSVMSTDGVFSNMVAARWNIAGFRTSSGISRLKTVQAEFCNGPHFIDAERLKELRLEGLIARIFTRNQTPLLM